MANNGRGGGKDLEKLEALARKHAEARGAGAWRSVAEERKDAGGERRT